MDFVYYYIQILPEFQGRPALTRKKYFYVFLCILDGYFRPAPAGCFADADGTPFAGNFCPGRIRERSVSGRRVRRLRHPT
jgi:hypothetical protein